MLREEIMIKTATGDLRGHLFVGHDHLPELRIPSPATLAKHGIDTGKSGFDDYYRPANIPAAWELRQIEGEDAGILEVEIYFDRIMDVVRVVQEEEVNHA